MRACALIWAAAMGAGALWAQHTYSPADVEDGGRLYRSTCVTCHGPNGNLIAGIDLMHGKFNHVSTDQDIIGVIRNGIPGTAMPPNNFTEFQAGTIVAYLRSMAADTTRTNLPPGDAARGRAIFEGKGQCLTCHAVRGEGSRTGPDLSDIGTLRREVQLEQSLIEPDAEILPQNAYVRAVTKAGATITGRILNQDAFHLMLIDTEQHLRMLDKSDLREWAFLEHSPMPSYKDKLSEQELADVVTYLASLKGVQVP